jgi:Tfp pilus assembly protein PilF
MSTLPDDARALAQVGVDALRRGDARKARESFERVVNAGQTGAMSYLGLAYACRGLGDNPAALAALDKALALEPRNPRALILKADCMADMGDSRAASAFYQFAIQAAPPDLDVPADLRGELARAQAMCDRYTEKF